MALLLWIDYGGFDIVVKVLFDHNCHDCAWFSPFQKDKPENLKQFQAADEVVA